MAAVTVAGDRGRPGAYSRPVSGPPTAGARRLPDFVVIGAARSGTTSLHNWLAAQPEVFMYPGKETHFFSQDWVWANGVDWYAGLFAGARPGQLVGEGSTSYTDPQYHRAAAERMAATVPDVKLLFIVRHPVARLRSDLDHHLRQGRETRPPEIAAADPDAPHAQRSHYFACLEPFIERFDKDQFCVVRFEDVVAPPYRGWDDVLRHLGLPPRPTPATVHNAGAGQPDARWLMQRLRRSRVGPATRRLPAPLRAAAKRLAGALSRPRPAGPGPVTVPAAVTGPIWADVARLEEWLELEAPLWEDPAEMRPSLGD